MTKERLYIYLPPEMREALSRAAKARGVSMSSLATMVLSEWLRQNEQSGEKDPLDEIAFSDWNPLYTVTYRIPGEHFTRTGVADRERFHEMIQQGYEILEVKAYLYDES